MVGQQLVWWWYRLWWWTPESRASRAFHRHGKAVYDEFRRRGLDGSHAEEATEFVFNALYERYRAGDQIADVEQFAVDITFGAAKRRMLERLGHPCPSSASKWPS